ncbi:single-domain globin Cgb [Campylobacter sp. US33a]|uniref:Single-domain globin Cgb n=1 Tax=Campylobacter sp. CCS1377 TaxID=3158229 RepID=A0AAU7E7P9_9BACT|nr:single-domain globin Cgb [Campylobacter sp. US33a]MCW1360808.1 single-domain globin Cgb [Campylobacter jejuni]TEY01974.1 globin [Campylobacter sp. US33a]
MTQEQIKIIKDCVPILQKSGEDLTKEFYKILFSDYPEVKPMFNMEKQASGEQPKALAMAILMAAKNVENLENMRNFVDKIAITHVNLGVKEEHYPIVGICLLKAIKNLLNPSEEVLKAWEIAYEKIAKFYIDIEKNLYEKK